MKSFFKIIIFIISILLVQPVLAFKVVKTTGDVKLKSKDGKTSSLKVAMGVFDGDTVVTLKESKALITDGNVMIRIGQMSEFYVREQKTHVVFDIKKGKALFDVQPQNASRYYFKVPSLW